MSTKPKNLDQIIGYRFHNQALLLQALTHRSYTKEAAKPSPHNERLEFLGDAILGFLVSESLIERFPSHSEGQLTKLKAYLVSAANLVHVARTLDLGSHLYLGRGEELTGGRDKKALLVNALEALISAVYLDGGLEAAGKFVSRTVLTAEALEAAEENLEIDNFKSALQELLQGRKLPSPSYQVVQESGPPHRRTFTTELRVGTLFTGRAEGSTKKSAEQRAARLALEYFTAKESSAREKRSKPTETQDAERP